MPVTVHKDDREPDWIFGPEVERAYRWFLNQWTGVLDRLQRSLVDALEAGDIDTSGGRIAIAADVRTEFGEFTNDLILVYRNGTENGIGAGRELAARRYNLDISFDLIPQHVLDEFQDWSAEATQSSMSTMTESVTNVIRGSQVEGHDIETIAENVNELFDNSLKEYQAVRTARTATISSSNAGSHSAYSDAQSVSALEWLATDDSRTRHTHNLADNQIVAVGTKFLVGGFEARYPGDIVNLPLREYVNCRCTSIPAFDLTEDQLATLRTGGRLNVPDEAQAAVA